MTDDPTTHTAHDVRPDARIRIATPADASLLADLGARLFEQTFGPENTAEDMAEYLRDAFSLEAVASELAEPARVVFIAEDSEDRAIGYAVLIRGETVDSVHGNRPAEIRRIYADRAVHGQGTGARLLQACVAHATEWKADVLWLAVWERNPRAIAFYEKHGFQRVGRKTFQLGRDVQHDFVMARKL